MNSDQTLRRSQIETALEELITNQRATDFQRMAVRLARARCPDLVASELSHDGGEDAFTAFTTTESRQLAVACSLTATLVKIKTDLGAIRARKPSISELWFFTPRKVRSTRSDPWRKALKSEYEVELTVFSREEIVSSLLEPQFQYLLPQYLGLAAGVLDASGKLEMQLRVLAPDRSRLWRELYAPKGVVPVQRHFKAHIPKQQLIPQYDIAAAADQVAAGGLVALIGEAGLGKTVTLASLADALATSTAGPVPVLLSAPSWARSGQTLLNFVSQQLTGQTADSATHLLQLCQAGSVAILLNGWNEIAADQLLTAHGQLADFRRSAPSCPLIVTARSRSNTEGLGTSLTLELLPLSQSARRQVIDWFAAGSATRIEAELNRNRQADPLSRLPLFLLAMIDVIVRGDTLPTTRYGILESALAAIERTADHREALLNPVVSVHWPSSLRRIAFELSRTGTTEMDRPVLLAIFTQHTGSLTTSAQILEVLVHHHVLEQDEKGAVRFQHQYFQDWYCAQYLMETCRTSADLTVSVLLDNRALNDAWNLVISSLGSASVAIAEASKFSDRLFRLALRVDVSFAAAWVPTLAKKISAVLETELIERLRQWKKQGPVAEKAALRAMLSTRMDWFADLWWSRLESTTHSVYQSTLALEIPFPVEVLGEGWRARMAHWGAERRTEFARLAASHFDKSGLSVARELALTDPDARVRVRCFVHLDAHETALARELLPDLRIQSVEVLLDCGYINDLPRGFVEPLLPELERAARQGSDNRSAVALSYLADFAPHMAAAIYREQLTEGIHDWSAERRAIEFVACHERLWVARFVLASIERGRYGATWEGARLEVLPEAERIEALQRIRVSAGAEPGQLARRLKPLLDCATPRMAYEWIDATINAIQQNPQTSGAESETELRAPREMLQAASTLPFDLLLTLASRWTSSLPGAEEVSLYCDVLSRSAANDGDAIPEPDAPRGSELRLFIEKAAAIVMADPDERGQRTLRVANLVTVVGYSELAPLCWALVDLESKRVRAFFAQSQGPESLGRKAPQSSYSHDREYLEMLLAVALDGTLDALIALMNDPVFERVAARAIMARTCIAPAGGIDRTRRSTNWIALGEMLRKPRGTILSPEARKAVTALERHIGEWQSGSRRPLREYEPAGPAAVEFNVLLAVITGRLDRQTFDALPINHHFAWQASTYFDELIVRGIEVPGKAVDRYLQASLDNLGRWSSGQDRWYLSRRFIVALLFCDSPELARQRFMEFIKRLDGSWELREVLVPLAVSPLSFKLEMLLSLLPELDSESRWHWSAAFDSLRSADRVTITIRLLDDARYLERDEEDSRRYELRSIHASLVRVAQENPRLRSEIVQAVRANRSKRHRQFAVDLLATVSDDAAVLMMIELAVRDPPFRAVAAAFLELARWELSDGFFVRPDFSSPRPLPRARTALLRLAHGPDSELAEWSRDQLHTLNAALQRGTPLNESRHPDVSSGLEWPPFEPQSPSRCS